MSTQASASSRIYYVLAVVVLAGSAAAMQVIDFQVIKKPLPLQKPLIDFDRDSLKPLVRVDANILSKDVVAELGTEEYIEWTLSDPRINDTSKAHLSLFLTYYTNVQDQVPHVPEECYYQGGSVMTGDETQAWSLSALPGEEIAVRRLEFARPDRPDSNSLVYYTINVNGMFFADRQGARFKLKSFNETHLYYSKVEIAFHGYSKNELEVLDKRARELMDITVGELFEEHWPPRGTEIGGYEGLKKKAAEAQASQS